MHKASVTACLRAPGDGPTRRQEVRTFGTTTRELLQLVDWLTAAGCTHVAMESTGVIWRLVKRRGDKKAIVAVAHSLLVIAYHVLRDGVSYRELGDDYFDQLNAQRLAALGYAVTLTKAAA